MFNKHRTAIILMAEDDPEDRELCSLAVKDAHINRDLRFVQDGQELIEYLHRSGKYRDPDKSPRPELIFIDLNLPGIDGHQALAQIKDSPKLRRIPVVVFTQSEEAEDILRTYQQGVSGYIVKPTTASEWSGIFKAIDDYWFRVVERPAY